MLNKLIFSFAVILCFTACKRDFFAESGPGSLQFSNDTIVFDTVFTTVGTITKTLKVYNRNDNPITISSIALANANSRGVYRLNVDGISGTSARDIKIAANDSIFIFVEATINPVDGNLPYLVTDSLLFFTNNKTQDVDLVAYGQNANFYTPKDILFVTNIDTIKYHSIEEDTQWDNTLPHVIYGYVIVEDNATLTINEGCQVYFHKGSGLIVGNPFLTNNGGSLIVNPDYDQKQNDPVIFQGDRLDSWYADVAGQWDRIWLSAGSTNNEINNSIIRNGTIGIHVDSVASSEPTLEVNNTIIDNMSDIGILAQGSHVIGENNVVTDCGRYSVVLNIGGKYDFKHCTFANYWSYSSRSTASILLNNFYEDINGTIQLRDLTQANFTNCILSGSLTHEIDLQKDNSAEFNYNFNHCLLKIHPDTNLSSFDQNNSIKIENNQTVFVDVQNDDYQLSEGSPAINAGIETNVTMDLLNEPRIGLPDIGAYEKID